MMILWFNQIRASQIELVGGKGANLGEMTHAGLEVPAGFCITTKAYQEIIHEKELWPIIQSLLNNNDSDDIMELESTSKKIRKHIKAAPLSKEIEHAICSAYDKMGANIHVAVRSSATAEDLPDASFAGQQESFLGVCGKADLLKHVSLCWASLWTQRAIAYRQNKGFDHKQVKLSVVVQKMIKSQTAGVLFTNNPLNGKQDEMLVNASYGLGESVVSGHITPDSIRLSRKDKPILKSHSIGSKEFRIDYLNAGGTVTKKNSIEERKLLCLNETQLSSLLALGDKVEKYYKSPQDIEWAFAEDALFLLQTRPVTSLDYTVDSIDKKPKKPLSNTQKKILDDILEHFPDAPYPLDYESVTQTYQQVLNTSSEFGIIMPAASSMIKIDDFGLSFIDPVKPRLSFRLLLLPYKIFKKLSLDSKLWIEVQEKRIQNKISDLQKIDLKHLDNETLINFVRDANALAAQIGNIRFSEYISPMIFRGILLKMFSWLARKEQIIAEDFLGDLSYKTVQINQAVDKLVKSVEKNEEIRNIILKTPPEKIMSALKSARQGASFLKELDAFLVKFGARTMKVYLPYSNQSWSENPAPLFASMSVVLRSEGITENKNQDIAKKYLLSKKSITKKLFWPLNFWFQNVLQKYRAGHVAREATLYEIERTFVQVRRGVNEISRRCMDAGHLETRDDILFVLSSELTVLLHKDKAAIEQLKKKILIRKKARSDSRHTWKSRHLVVNTDADYLTAGLSGSPGMSTGPARIIQGATDFAKLKTGDILVCPFTDPTWTPLFSMVAAVVADTGGPLSHAAIVAREFGIPAVLGTGDATIQLQDDLMITVDGTNGKVYLAT